jgi:hypothetical protein
MLRLAALWLVGLSACASSQVVSRCPTTVAAPSPSIAAAPQGSPVPTLLAAMPRDADVMVRVDVQRLFGTRLGRLIAPALVWSREYAPARAACTLRPWEEARGVEIALRGNQAALALQGPIAVPGHRCAESVFSRPETSDRLLRISGSSPALILGDSALRESFAAARSGRASAQGDLAFTGLSPGLAAPLATVLVRGAYLRQALATVVPEGTPPAPSSSTERALEALLGGRLELGLTPSGDVQLRLSMLYPSAAHAQAFVAAMREELQTHLPSLLAQAVLDSMRDNPDGPRAAQEIASEAFAWIRELSPMEAHGASVETSLDSGGTLVGAGILSAVAIPAFTRYTRQSKTAEAMQYLSQIALALSTELNMAQGNRQRRRLSAIPPTPAEVPGEDPYPADPARWQAPGWRAIRFSIETSHRFQYRVDVEGRCYLVVASGDLDGDGVRSTFSRSVCPDAQGEYSPGPTRIENELE